MTTATQQIKDTSTLVGDIQDSLQQAGVTAAKSTLQAQLDKQSAAVLNATINPQAGKAGKQAGLARATRSKNAQVETARRVARTLAQNGPISIDDVTEELVKQGREKAVVGAGDQAHLWKGSVFRTSEFVQVHEELARLARSHARPIKLWALKSWLEKNSLNGTQMHRSKFDIDGIRRDFERANPNIPKDNCHWFVGANKLADSVATDIKAAGNSYQGVPVTFVPFATGAILQYAPPQIGKQIVSAMQPTVPPTTLRSQELK